MITFLCEHCERHVQTSSEAAGLPIRCPHCQSMVEVPRTSAATASRSVPGSGLKASYPDRAVPEPEAPLEPQKGAGRVARVVGGLLLLAAGVGMGVAGLAPLRDYLASGSWPTAEGVVESTDLLTLIKKSRWGRKSSEYKPVVRYRYTIAGTEYQGHSMGFGEDWDREEGTSERAAKAVLERHPEGAKVSVLYDPARPDRSVLQRRMSLSPLWMALLGLGGAWVGLRLLLIGVTPHGVESGTRWPLLRRRLSVLDYVVGMPTLGVGVLMVALTQML